jgi:hypothetical protein
MRVRKDSIEQGYRTASGSERDQSATSQVGSSLRNVIHTSSLYPARYRSRFCRGRHSAVAMSILFVALLFLAPTASAQTPQVNKV